MHLRSRIRVCTWFLIVGLAVSGLTAIPIQSEMALGRVVLGDDLSGGGHLPARVVTWLRTLDDGIAATSRDAPFMFYGTDWLAFGHFVIALVFVGALADPVRNRWLYRFGMMASLLVPLWAAVFGQVRGIPIWWRLIDASFGVVAFIPAWLCYRWTGDLEISEGHGKEDEPRRNLRSISPFLIVKDLQISIAYYIERFGFQLDFQGPDGDPYYASVSRDGIGIMLKAILPDVLPQPNHTRHDWARWDAYIYTRDPDALFDEFSRRGASFVKTLSFIDDGLWGFEVTDADGYVLAFFHLRRD